MRISFTGRHGKVPSRCHSHSYRGRSCAFHFAIAFAFFCLGPASIAQLSITAKEPGATITFDSTIEGVSNGAFTGTGFQAKPEEGQLDSDAWAMTGWSEGDLKFGEAQVTGDYARGTASGAVSKQGVYAFEINPEKGNAALGFQPDKGGKSWAPGTVTLQAVNNTGSLLTMIELSYTVYAFNDTKSSSSLTFSYSADGETFLPVGALDFTSPQAADRAPSWESSLRSTTLTGLKIEDSGALYFRWSSDEVSGKGTARDQLALDDIAISSVPEPTTVFAALTLIVFVVWRERRRFGAWRLAPPTR